MHVASKLLLCTALLGGVAPVQAGGLATPAAPTAPGAPALAVPLTLENILQSLSHDLAAHFRLEGELQLELLRPFTPPTRLASNWDVAITSYPSAATSSMLVRCRISADGAVAADATLVLRASLWRDAWTTRQQLTAGSVFDPASLETRRVNAFLDRDALPVSVGDRSYIFARGVPAGRMLTWNDVARRPLVKKGDLVEVSAADGLLNVSMKGLAMQNGAQGDTVTVRNPESRKDFSALVIDENRVQVRF